MSRIRHKVGYEFEFIAPLHKSRRDLAEIFCQIFDGETHTYLSQQSELGSEKSGQKRSFDNLTPGFRVTDQQGQWLFSFVDDITIQKGLNKQAKSKKGWFRILSDDSRFLELVTLHCDPKAPEEKILAPFAKLFDTHVSQDEHGLFLTKTQSGKTLCIQSGLPGERERPCEIITAPLQHSQLEVLQLIFDVVQANQFELAKEAATHIHFDASKLKQGSILQELVLFFYNFRAKIRQWAGTNPECSRILPFSPQLVEAAQTQKLLNLPWVEVKKLCLACSVSKYCDVNLKNLVLEHPDKNTIEIRMLPGSLDSEKIFSWTKTFDQLLHFFEQGGKHQNGWNYFDC